MKKEKRDRIMTIWFGILIFIISFLSGAASKLFIKPAWSKNYSVEWDESIGTMISDIAYGNGEKNTFDLYLPQNNTRENYGLVVYLHAGGFTSGDKVGDAKTLEWLCSKGYVAAGINYTLCSEEHPDANVYTQSMEIKEAVPFVVEAAKKAGYNIDKMTVAGGSAGHALAMIYAYRDGKEAPVPVVFTYGGVGPSSFYQEDWGIFGLDQDDEACAAMFSVMSGDTISPEEIRSGEYLEKVKPIAASEWVSNNPVPTVVAYGKYDKMQPFAVSVKLETALKENNVDYKYYVLPHSGHGLQNDDKISKQWMESIEEYLERYMPVK